MANQKSSTRVSSLFPLWLLLVLVVMSGVAAITRDSAITLENNEYQNVLVAIHPSVPEDVNLVQKIQEVFTKTSAYLYEATNQRAVFRDVTILVPNTWTANFQRATTEVLINADVLVANPPGADAPDLVQADAAEEPVTPPGGFMQLPPLSHHVATTKAYAGCGHPGVRVTMTADLFTMGAREANELGSADRILAREWAKFRWGVFDEYGLPGEPLFYFSPKTGVLEGVRCTEMIKGTIYRNLPNGRFEMCHDPDTSTGLYAEGCMFKPFPRGPATTGVEASILDSPTIYPITKFCNDDASNDATVHNYDAPSRHNRLCGHRSAWAVISESQDFENGRNPPRQGLDTQPTFTVVKAPNSRRMVLALDTSNTMQEDNKLPWAQQAINTFLRATAAPGAEASLDVVTFNSSAHAHNTSDHRQGFASDLSNTTENNLNISSGFLTTAETLVEHTTTSAPSRDTHFGTTELPRIPADPGHVVVVTDGQGTLGPDMKSALSMFQDAGVMISFIVVGNPPHPDFYHVARTTGGRVYCDNHHPESTAFVDAMFDLLQASDSASPNPPVQLERRAAGLNTGEKLEGTVVVDRDLGKYTTFLVTFNRSLPEVEVTSPSGRLYNSVCPAYSVDDRLQVVSIRIPNTAETGVWRYKVLNPGRYQVLSILVLSSAVTPSVPAVRLSGSLVLRRHAQPVTMHIFAELSQGPRAVTNLKVKADIYAPDGSTVQVELMDNGAGADIVEGDGVYSRFFSRFTVPGVYTVRLSATGHNAAPETSPIHLVQRTASAGHFVLQPHEQRTRSDDWEPPVRISDLRVVQTSGHHRTVVLTWTAPGDDTDHGSALEYQILIAPSARHLLAQSSLVQRLTHRDVIFGNLLAPQPFGAREFLVIRIPTSLYNNGSYVIAVVAIDDAGNRGDHSNYVTFGLGNVPDVHDPKYLGQMEHAFGRRPSAASQKHVPKHRRILLASVSATVAVLLIFVIAMIIKVCRKNSKVLPLKSKPSDKADKPKAGWVKSISESVSKEKVPFRAGEYDV